MIGFVDSAMKLQAAMVCVKKTILNPARFFLLNNDGNVQLVIHNLLYLTLVMCRRLTA